jgi:hypothetical protein
MSDTVYLRNNAKCNIILPGFDDMVKGLVSPGEAIEVSAEAAKSGFVKGLIRSGELSVVEDAAIVDDEPEADKKKAK